MMSLHSAHHLHVELSAESAEAHHQKFMRDIEWRRNFFTDWMKNVFCFFTGALDRRKRDFFRVPPFMTSSERIKVVGMLVVVGSRNRQGHRAKAKIAKPSIAQPNTFSFQLNQRRRQMGCFSTPPLPKMDSFPTWPRYEIFPFREKAKNVSCPLHLLEIDFDQLNHLRLWLLRVAKALSSENFASGSARRETLFFFAQFFSLRFFTQFSIASYRSTTLFNGIETLRS